jgi:CRISPR/Cas system-associated exonuclease Cas4 (RecB family)
MYFLTEEEKKRLLKGFLPKSREQGVAEELRGWNWSQPPLEPAYDYQRADIVPLGVMYFYAGWSILKPNLIWQ